MHRRIALMAAVAILLPASALAQTADDVVVMRRFIAAPAPKAGEWRLGPPVADAPSCSDRAPATATVRCLDADGDELPPSRCSGSRPSGATTVVDHRSCVHDWVLSTTGDWSTTCGSATRTSTYACIRSGGDAAGPVDASNCVSRADRPVATETATQQSGCPKMTCGSLEPRTWPSALPGPMNGTGIRIAQVNSATDALALCKTRPDLGNGACTWASDSRWATYYPSTGAAVGPNRFAELHATVCTVQ